MKHSLIVVAAFLSLAVSAAIAAPPADKGKPDDPGQSASAPGQQAAKNAAKTCKAERAQSGVEAFRDKYGTNANKMNAFGKCVSAMVAKAKTEANEQAEENAARKCKAERTQLGVQAFKDKYGTNPNKANAFGKCVSKLAKAHGSA